MQLKIEETTHDADAVDLRDRSVDRSALVAAIRDEPSPYAVDCPTPGPVHERAGVVFPGMGLKPRTALAAAARSRGVATPHDERIDRVADELTDLADSIDADHPPLPDGPPAADLADLRERAAELRGQVEALAAAGDADPTDARAELRETAARLSELETERIAAEQTRERTRERRDRRERRLRLEDRLANARRDARAALVERVRDEYERAVTGVYGKGRGPPPRDAPDDPFAVPAPVAALAILRVARVRAPVVLDVADVDVTHTDVADINDTDATDPALDGDRVPDDLLPNPAHTADWLDAPVLRL